MVLLFMILLVIINKYLYKSFLNPIFIQSLIWIVYYIILQINIDEYDVNLSDITPMILLQLAGFSLGGFITHLFTSRSSLVTKTLADNELSVIENNVRFLFPFIALLLLVCLVTLARQTGSLSIFAIADLRNQLTEDDGKQYGLLGTIQFLISIYLILYFISKRKTEVRFVVLLFFFFYYTLLLGSRQAFLFFFASLAYALMWQKKIKVRTLLLFAGVMIGFFLALTFLRDHNENDDDLLLNIFLSYTVSSLPALFLSSPQAGVLAGTYTFRNIFLWLNKFGGSFYIISILSEFVSTPFYTNVFSYIRPYYYDFGLTGVFIIPLLLGAVYNWLYFSASNGKISRLIILALSIFPLIMQIFDELYFNWFSNWLYFTVFILLITKFRIYEFGRSRRNLSSIHP